MHATGTRPVNIERRTRGGQVRRYLNSCLLANSQQHQQFPDPNNPRDMIETGKVGSVKQLGPLLALMRGSSVCRHPSLLGTLLALLSCLGTWLHHPRTGPSPWALVAAPSVLSLPAQNPPSVVVLVRSTAFNHGCLTSCSLSLYFLDLKRRCGAPDRTAEREGRGTATLTESSHTSQEPRQSALASLHVAGQV